MAWPCGDGSKLFVALRPDTANVQSILTGLASIEARVICVAVGFSKEQLRPFQKKHILFSERVVELDSLVDADLCVTYGAEGTMLRFLVAGVPQIISPTHVETFMAARRIEASGFGSYLPPQSDIEMVKKKIVTILADASIRENLRMFAGRSAVPHGAEIVVETIEAVSSKLGLGHSSEESALRSAEPTATETT